MNDVKEIKNKLKGLIENRLNSEEPINPFGDYFSDGKFKEMLDNVLFEKS